jgi:transcriptional regulator of acetoin/glycerol metabolism
MARHNRARWPRDREQRELAEGRYSQIFAALVYQAYKVHELEAAASAARAELNRRGVELARSHTMDITVIARELGISRETMYRLIRSHSGSAGAPPS